MKVRVRFSKQGNMKFIGHLDIMRYFQKAIRRAGIDIAYSEGLSPHMIMSFAAPLGVGLTSDAEYMDIELRTPIGSDDAIRALNRVGVEGITVTGFRKVPDGKAGNAMTLVAAADYELRFRRGYEPETDWISGIPDFFARSSIPVMKKTKKSEKEVDIRPMIYELSVIPARSARTVPEQVGCGSAPGSETYVSEQAGLKTETAGDARRQEPDDAPVVRMKLASGSVANLKPELVMDTYLKTLGLGVPPVAYEINRCEIYANFGTAENPRLVSLEALGEQI